MPYVRFKKVDDKIEFVNGIEVKIIETIQRYLNFTIEIIDCHSVWGQEKANKSWNGLVGAIMNDVNIECLLIRVITRFYNFSKLI